MLLNNYETHKSGSNLKSLEAAAWYTMDHVVPIIQTNSCLPFLYSCSEYVKTSNNKKVYYYFTTFNFNIMFLILAQTQFLDTQKYPIVFNSVTETGKILFNKQLVFQA